MIYLLNKNNMKKLAYIATIACSMFLTTSCVDLTQEPQSFITDEDYIASMDLTGLQQAATGLYNDLWNGNYGFNCRLQRINVCADDIDLETKEEKEELQKVNDENKDMFELMKEAVGEEVDKVRYTHKLKNHPVCLTSEGAISVKMEKVINSMPNNEEKIKAQTILEINENHPIAQKIKDLYENNKDELKEYTKVLYAQARLIEGLPIENPTEISNLVCNLISK